MAAEKKTNAQSTSPSSVVAGKLLANQNTGGFWSPLKSLDHTIMTIYIQREN